MKDLFTNLGVLRGSEKWQTKKHYYQGVLEKDLIFFMYPTLQKSYALDWQKFSIWDIYWPPWEHPENSQVLPRQYPGALKQNLS